MATTRIIPLHLNKGKTFRQCLRDRIGYGMNPEKTENGELISAYACDPESADADFVLPKRECFQLTGSKQEKSTLGSQNTIKIELAIGILTGCNKRY